MLNDDSIINDGFYVRDSLSNDGKLQTRLIDLIRNADFADGQSFTLREYVLFVLLRVSQRDAAFKNTIDQDMNNHLKALDAALTKFPEKKDRLDGEIMKTADVLRADKIDNMLNFPDIKPEFVEINTIVRRTTVANILPPINPNG